MRRLTLWIVMLAALLMGQALAAELPDFTTLSTLFGGSDGWKQYRVEELQTYKTEEGAAMTACLDEGSVAALTIEVDRIFDGETEDTEAEKTMMREQLTALGCFAEEDIDAILAQEARSTQTYSGFTVLRLDGRNRWALCVCAEEAYADKRFIAVHGGVRIHTNPNCSGMDTARMVTEEAAALTGLAPCGLCGSGE